MGWWLYLYDPFSPALSPAFTFITGLHSQASASLFMVNVAIDGAGGGPRYQNHPSTWPLSLPWGYPSMPRSLCAPPSFSLMCNLLSDSFLCVTSQTCLFSTCFSPIWVISSFLFLYRHRTWCHSKEIATTSCVSSLLLPCTVILTMPQGG